MPALKDIADDLRWADAELAGHAPTLELKIARAHLGLALQSLGHAVAADRGPVVIDHAAAVVVDALERVPA